MYFFHFVSPRGRAQYGIENEGASDGLRFQSEAAPRRVLGAIFAMVEDETRVPSLRNR